MTSNTKIILLIYGTIISQNIVDCKVVVFNSVQDQARQQSSLYESIEPASEETILKEGQQYWLEKGKDTLNARLEFRNKENKLKVAKNVILFIGDGMGISTITAGRVYKGQRTPGYAGEEYELSFDKFPNVALVKTYNLDMQVPDSAATATAIFTGVKTRYEIVSLDVNCNNVTFDLDTYNRSKLTSLMTWAQQAKKSTGMVTNTRITHATPAASFGHANNRYWECDAKLPATIKGQIKDLARQLIEDEPGRNFNVILGGGYQLLGHTTQLTAGCTRTDGLNLTKTWIENHDSKDSVFTTTRDGLLNGVTDSTNYLLGLFGPDHLPYTLAKGPEVPRLVEMVQKAVQVLRKNENGFVLAVEGGLIDRAHHKNYARLAMHETSELDDAVQYVINEFGDDTLILVTADHSHAFTMQGYSQRGNDILGYGIDNRPNDFRPLQTLAYANGPGFNYQFHPNGTNTNVFPWRDPSTDPNRLNDTFYQSVAGFELVDETHGGEDVALFAIGPNSNLVRGVVEQNFIAHLISYSGCFGPYAELNEACSGTTKLSCCFGFVLLALLIKFFD